MSRKWDGVLSRRTWMERVSAPALVAAAIGGSREASAQEAAPAETPAVDASRGARVYNVRDHGAKGDGATLDTAAVQAAIDACHKDDGGTVLVPAGDFVVGTLELKSHVTLHLTVKGRLLGSPRIEDYHAGNGVPTSNGNIVLISAANAENVAIDGPGTIDGNGAKFFTGRGDATGPGDDRSQAYYHRPHLMVFYKVQNLRLRDTYLTASAYHCVRILQCKQVLLDGVRIYNRVNLNNDGFHINSSEYVHIVNCDIKCQDDACALFGSNKFVTVTNSTFSTRWSCFRFGGGEPENITISNVVIYETYGCPIKISMGRGSRMENVLFENIVMRDVTGPISVGLRSRPRDGANANASASTRPPGVVRNLRFSGIRATVVSEGRQHPDLPRPSRFREGELRTCIVVNGAGDDAIEDITFNDVHVTFGGGGTAAESRREIAPIAGEYFEIGTPPAYGLYARNVRGLTLQNVRFAVSSPDLRPAIVFDRVEDAAVNGLSVQGNAQAESLLRFTNTKDVLLTGCRAVTPAAVFLRLEGARNENIAIDGGDLSKAAQALSFGEGSSETAVRRRT
jgi:polygalacturonase